MKIQLLFLHAFLCAFANAQTPGWQWAKRVGSFNDNAPFTTGDQNERFNDIKVDSLGNVYAVGEFFQNSAFDNQTTGFPTTGGYGERDAYLMKFDKCGKTLWWRRMGGVGFDMGKSLVLDNNGFVTVAGECASSTYTISDGVNDTILNNNSTPLFLAKFDTAGNFIKASSYSSFSNINVLGLVKIFINSQNDYFLTNGLSSYVIPATLGPIAATYSYAANAPYWLPDIRGITLDKNDNVYLCGAFNNTISIGGTTLVPNFGYSSLIMKYSPVGILQWYNQGNANSGSGNRLYNCTLDTSGTVFITGGLATSNTTVFGYSVVGPAASPSFCGYVNPFFFFNASTGSLLSAITATSQCQDAVAPIFTDRNNNIHCAGTMNGYFKFGTNTYSTNPVTTTRQNCIAKLDLSGNLLNFSTVPQSGSSNGTVREGVNALTTDTLGNVYIAGMFGGTIDSLGTAVNIIGGNEDGFIAKYGFGCGSAPTGSVPNVPLALAATNNSLINNISWTDNSTNEANFELHYTISPSVTYSLLATLPANTTSYTHTGLSYTTTYCYKVAATNSIGTSAFSNTDCATTPAPPTATSTPNAPLNLTAINNGSLTNNVAWVDNSSDEANFELHYTIGSSTTYSLLATLAPNTTGYAHTGLSYTSTYCYKVAATNSVGSSAFSNTDCATTPAAPNDTTGTGIAEQQLLNLNMQVFPNPTSGEVMLQFPPLGAEAYIEVINSLGETLQSIKQAANKNVLMSNLLIQLPKVKGLYFIKITAGTSRASVVRKVVVE